MTEEKSPDSNQAVKAPESCGSCVFFRPCLCRRHPPKAEGFTYQYSDGSTQDSVRTIWPEVGFNDWCGEYQPKVEQEPK